MNREQLIEKAAKAIRDAGGASPFAWETLPEAHREYRREQARAALAVFEEAYANDLATSPEHAKNPGDSLHVETANVSEPHVADISSGQMSVSANTPTDDEREVLWDAFDDMHRITEGGCDTRGKDVSNMVLRLDAEPGTVQGEPSAFEKRHADHEHVGPYCMPQGEPTDAAVLAAMEAYSEYRESDGPGDAMRAALRAAAATEGGER